MAKQHRQFIYSLADPGSPDAIRYVGRTNTPELRLRMHVGSAAFGFTVKDVWLTYLHYAGSGPAMETVEQETFDDSGAASAWAKERERFWINHFAEAGHELVNREKWWSHPRRRGIPNGIRAAWIEAHALLFSIDRNWDDAIRLLTHLEEQYGPITKMTQLPNGSTGVQSMAEISEARSRYERDRWRAMAILKGLVDEFPAMAIGDVNGLQWR